MDCGVPFCQSDHGCPLGNIIPKWNDLVYNVCTYKHSGPLSYDHRSCVPVDVHTLFRITISRLLHYICEIQPNLLKGHLSGLEEGNLYGLYQFFYQLFSVFFIILQNSSLLNIRVLISPYKYLNIWTCRKQ